MAKVTIYSEQRARRIAESRVRKSNPAANPDEIRAKSSSLLRAISHEDIEALKSNGLVKSDLRAHGAGFGYLVCRGK